MDIDRTRGQRKLSFGIFPTLAFQKAYRPDNSRTRNVLILRQNYRNDHNGFGRTQLSDTPRQTLTECFAYFPDYITPITIVQKQQSNVESLSPIAIVDYRQKRIDFERTAKSIDSFSFGRQHMAHLTFPSAIH